MPLGAIEDTCNTVCTIIIFVFPDSQALAHLLCSTGVKQREAPMVAIQVASSDHYSYLHGETSRWYRSGFNA